jgi:hypothetical protein
MGWWNEFVSRTMKDLASPRWIKLKGALFLLLGVMSGGLLLLEQPSLKMVLLLGLTVWGFCRCYYFAFYVLERYVDPGYRFSGLWSFARHLLAKRRRDRPSD